MAYQVFARKYRPQTFEEVVGQEPVVRALSNALRTGRISYAYLFSGMRGVGKTTVARILAKALNCEKGPTPEPCGECPACVEIAASGAIDVQEVDAASFSKVENIRELLSGVPYRPARDRFKVYIMDEAHRLSPNAFDALLKTLEEPPPHVVFMMATTEARKVPDTIVSRCQHFEFRPIPSRGIMDQLREVAGREGIEASTGALALLARRAGGSLRDAQSLLDRVACACGDSFHEEEVAQLLGVAERGALRELLVSVAGSDAGQVLDRLDTLLSLGVDPVELHRDLVEEVRDVMVAGSSPEPAKLLAGGEEEVAPLKEAASRFRPAEIMRLLNLLVDGEVMVRGAREPRFALEALLVRAALLGQLADIEEVLRSLTGEGGASSGGGGRGEDRSREGAPARGASRANGQEPARPEEPKGVEPRGGDTHPVRAESSDASAIRNAIESQVLRGMLAKADLQVEGDEIRVLLPAQGFARKQIQKRENQDAILAAAESALGRKRKLRLVEGGKGAPKPAPEKVEKAAASTNPSGLDDPRVKKIVKLFNGKIVEAQETTEEEIP